MKKMMLCVVGAVAVALCASAEQKTVPAGTTVTVAAADVASWKDADIDIGAGATLWFEEPDAHAVFTGKITGSGHFVVNSRLSTLPSPFIA